MPSRIEDASKQLKLSREELLQSGDTPISLCNSLKRLSIGLSECVKFVAELSGGTVDDSVNICSMLTDTSLSSKLSPYSWYRELKLLALVTRDVCNGCLYDGVIEFSRSMVNAIALLLDRMVDDLRPEETTVFMSQVNKYLQGTGLALTFSSLRAYIPETYFDKSDLSDVEVEHIVDSALKNWLIVWE